MKNKLEKLFNHHAHDLISLCGNRESVFVCPLCFKEFRADAITKGQVDEGHVWPEYFRTAENVNKRVAEQMIVLLCKHCNSTAGSRGDAKLTDVKKNFDNEAKGILKHVKLMGYADNNFIKNKPVELPRSSATLGENSVNLDWEVIKKTHHPTDVSAFREQFSRPTDLFLIPNLPSLQDRWLAHVGLITSAYLFGFYIFGYRLIFQKSFDGIRALINSSFDKSKTIDNAVPDMGTPDNVSILEAKGRFFSTPVILGHVDPVRMGDNFFHIWFHNLGVIYPVRTSIETDKPVIFDIRREISAAEESKIDFHTMLPLPDYRYIDEE